MKFIYSSMGHFFAVQSQGDIILVHDTNILWPGIFVNSLNFRAFLLDIHSIANNQFKTITTLVNQSTSVINSQQQQLLRKAESSQHEKLKC